MIARPMPNIVLNGVTVKELFSYDPETGVLRWNISGGKIRKGDVTGCPDNKGYLRTRYAGKYYKTARIIWLWMTGEWPNNEVDHIDLDPSNNKWENLRDATHSQNMANCTVRSDSISGTKGVVFYTPRNKWLARINGQHIGYFATELEAKAAYNNEAAKRYGEFARA